MHSSFKAVQNVGVLQNIVSSRAKVSIVVASATCIQSSNSYTSGLPIQKQKSKPNSQSQIHPPSKIHKTNPRSCPLHRALKRPCRFIWMHQRSSRESNGAPKSAPRVAFEGLPNTLQALHHNAIIDQLRCHRDLQEMKERGQTLSQESNCAAHNASHNHYMQLKRVF